MNSISELNGLTKFQLGLPSTLDNGVSGDTGIIYIRLPHSRDGCHWSISTPGIAPLGLTVGSGAEQAFWDSAPSLPLLFLCNNFRGSKSQQKVILNSRPGLTQIQSSGIFPWNPVSQIYTGVYWECSGMGAGG